jgi:hypothetical protein
MPVRLPLAKVVALRNPYSDCPWPHSEIRPWEIRKAVAEKRLRRELTDGWHGCYSRKENIERIAYFVVRGWRDPIGIDVGVPGLSFHEPALTDGYHRLSAAMFRKDSHIRAVVDGDLKYAFELFGVNCEEKHDRWPKAR